MEELWQIKSKKGSALGKARSVGEFCWIDVAARDITKETNFFKQTLNWDVREIPMPQGAYPMIFVGDGAVGGFMDLQRLPKGTPPHLSATIRVDKLDKAFALALKNGAKEISKPSEVSDLGKIAVIADPTGAAVTLWEVIKHEGITADLMSEGVPSWFELMTNQPDISQRFWPRLYRRPKVTSRPTVFPQLSKGVSPRGERRQQERPRKRGLQSRDLPKNN